MESSVGDVAEYLVKSPRLETVQPAVESRGPVGNRHLGTAGHRSDERPEALGQDLEVRWERDKQIPSAPLDTKAKSGGLSESLGEAMQSKVIGPGGQCRELRTWGEAPVENEQKFKVLAQPLQFPGEGLIKCGQVIDPFHYRDDDRDHLPGWLVRGQCRGVCGLRPNSLRRHISEPPTPSESRWRSPVRCSRPPRPQGRA